jgi:hypothetical protein
MTAADKRDRKFNLSFRNAEEKREAAKQASAEGHPSLNAYFLWLYRQHLKRSTSSSPPPATAAAEAPQP